MIIKLKGVLKEIFRIQRYYILVGPTDGPKTIREPIVKFFQAYEGDLDELTEGYEYNHEKRERDKQSLRDGEVCYIGYLGDEIVFYGWLSTKKFFIPEVLDIPLGEGKMYGYRAFVVPHLRNKGIFKQYYKYRGREIKKYYPHVQEILTYTNTKNDPALSTMFSSGFSVVGTMKIINFLRWKKIIVPEEVRSYIQK